MEIKVTVENTDNAYAVKAEAKDGTHNQFLAALQSLAGSFGRLCTHLGMENEEILQELFLAMFKGVVHSKPVSNTSTFVDIGKIRGERE